MPRAWISLGANLGRPQATLTAAAKALEQSEGIAHLRLSSFYSTSPVDSSGPDYVNAAAAVDTNCSPEALLKLLQRIEYAHGRVRPCAPRLGSGRRKPSQLAERLAEVPQVIGQPVQQHAERQGAARHHVDGREHKRGQLLRAELR